MKQGPCNTRALAEKSAGNFLLARLIGGRLPIWRSS
jgi:hypothetical protein